MSSAGRYAQAVIAACLLILGLVWAGDARAQAPLLTYSCYYGTASAGCTTVTPTSGLPVQIVSGGGSGGTASTFGAAFPATGTAIGVKNGANMVNLLADGSSNLLVNCAVGCSGGTFNNNADAVATSATNGSTAAYLYGFNGATFDRLRVDGSKNLLVGVNAALPVGANTIGAVTQASGPWTVNLTQVAGSAISQGHGTAATAVRVELPTDGTGTVGLIAGAATIGTVRNVGNAGGIFDFPGQNAASPANAILTGCQFQTSPTTITASNSSPIQCDNAANALVKVNVALPTGANVIGAVTQSGTWNVGLSAGAATVGKIDILGNAGAILDFPGQNAASPANSVLTGCQFNTSPTTITTTNSSPIQCDSAANALVKVNVALPTGANTIGAVTQASGPWSSNITQVAGATISQGNGTAATAIRVALPTDGTGVVGLSTGTNTIGNVGNVPITAGGLTMFREIVPNNTTSVAVKASAGQLYSIDAYSISAATPAYIKFYNTAQGSVTCGTPTPTFGPFLIPASGGAPGSGFVMHDTNGYAFSTAITVCVTAGIADNDTTAPAASTYVLNIGYK